MEAESFVKVLASEGVGLFCGVPDSLLKSFCAYLTDHAGRGFSHVITANEGGAVGLAAGHYLATGLPAVVYMQNSGQGNAVNPLASLADPDVYSIPMVLVVGWRGMPGVKDEPQHVKQGKITVSLFETMGIPTEVLPDDDAAALAAAKATVARAKSESRPVALVVKKGFFGEYRLKRREPDLAPIRREAVIEALVRALPADAALVSTTGMISREVYETRERLGQGHANDFLTVGSMGHALMIALGIARAQSKRKVVCLDGDGASIMQMGNMAIAGRSGCANLCHVVLNNAAHDSVGGQPTLGGSLDFERLARDFGYMVLEADDEASLVDPVQIEADFRGIFADLGEMGRPVFVAFKVAKGARADLGRPKEPPAVNKALFMQTLAR